MLGAVASAFRTAIYDGAELTDEERAASGIDRSVDDIALDLDTSGNETLA